MKTLHDLEVTPGMLVLVRAGLNVPIEGGRVVNDYRLRRALPTLLRLREQGAKVIVASHLGEAGTETLEPVTQALAALTSRVFFSPEPLGKVAEEKIAAMSPGDILVLENLRRHPGEVANDLAFAKELASLADVFVQDAFDTCHRKHASMVGVPRFLPSYAGLLVEEEVAELSRALSPESPSLAVIGGAKFSTKEPVLTTLLKSYTHVCVGGALANDVSLAAGNPVGKSLVSGGDAGPVTALLSEKHFVMPVDFRVVPSELTKTPGIALRARVSSPHDVRPDETILDEGPGTTALLGNLAQKAKTILWNGPLGNYENGFVEATNAFAKAVAASGAHSIIGGGDTIAAIESLNLLSKFSFVSTGGGSMLDFLAHGTLPALEALNR